MKPQIDAMFRRTAPSEHPVTSPSSTHRTAFLPTPPTSGSSSPSPFASSLLNTITTSATAGPPATPAQTPPRPSPETSPLILISSSSYFARILKQHPAVVVNFTNTPSCPPCRVIKPVYEAIASGYASTFGVKGARFVEVELSVGEGRDIASRYGVSATPTFMFFRDGKKVDELRGAAKRELEAKVEEFLESVWPSHPHRKVYLSQVESLPTTPLTSTTVPKYPALLEKLESFGTNETAITLFKDQVVPFLEGKTTLSDADLETMAMVWSITSAELLATLEPEQTFPIIDLWRVGLLKPRLAAFVALKLSTGAPDNATESVSPIVALATMIVKRQGTSTPKPFLITTLRLLTNLLAPLPVANLVLASCSDERLSTLQENVVSLVVDSLLHSDAGVRSAAAGVSVNMAVWRHRVANKVKRAAEDGDEAEWEVELVSALVEGIGRETDEDVGEWTCRVDESWKQTPDCSISTPITRGIGIDIASVSRVRRVAATFIGSVGSEKRDWGESPGMEEERGEEACRGDYSQAMLEDEEQCPAESRPVDGAQVI